MLHITETIKKEAMDNIIDGANIRAIECPLKKCTHCASYGWPVN